MQKHVVHGANRSLGAPLAKEAAVYHPNDFSAIASALAAEVFLRHLGHHIEQRISARLAGDLVTDLGGTPPLDSCLS
jgi:hypothetical protein